MIWNPMCRCVQSALHFTVLQSCSFNHNNLFSWIQSDVLQILSTKYLCIVYKYKYIMYVLLSQMAKYVCIVYKYFDL